MNGAEARNRRSDALQASVEVVDLLATRPSRDSFSQRVRQLQLGKKLESKAIRASNGSTEQITLRLTEAEEKELATEVLLLRHKFTEIVWRSVQFRQAALTIIQNIYLFKHRRIFFDPTGPRYDKERQEALYLFSTYSSNHSLPLNKTFQHLIIARIWNRITQTMDSVSFESSEFLELEETVQRLNTLRNIYVVLCSGLIKSLTSKASKLYKESVTPEDARQIGCFGVARAAYRYHQSTGVRFSTFAAHWIKKEIQRQSLSGRLLRISTDTVEKYAQAQKSNNEKQLEFYGSIIRNSSWAGDEIDHQTGIDQRLDHDLAKGSSPELQQERRELKRLTRQLLEKTLSPREADIIQRRFALSPYDGMEQSAVSIAESYGVTRSAIYQIEYKALLKLKKAFKMFYETYN